MADINIFHFFKAGYSAFLQGFHCRTEEELHFIKEPSCFILFAIVV